LLALSTFRIRRAWSLIVVAVAGLSSGTAIALDPGSRPVERVIDADGRTCDGQTPTITGSDADDSLAGTEDDDVILAGKGVDLVDAGAGDDTICARGDDDAAAGGEGADKIRGGGGDDTIFGGAGDDELLGGRGDDQIFGEDDDDQIDGRRGDDGCSGGPGADELENCELRGAVETPPTGDASPVAVNDSPTLIEDSGPNTIDVRANDTDSDGGQKTITAKTDGAHGRVVIADDGTDLTYRPDPDYCNDPGVAEDTFTYTLNGGSTATVAVTVRCVDDSPTAVDDTRTVAEDSGATAIDVRANDTDPDGGPKTIASKTDGAHGDVVLTGGSPGAHTALTYKPDPDFCGSDSFTYALNGGSTATVSVTVSCVEDRLLVLDLP
jgi:VCBS repeat-containing protein